MRATLALAALTGGPLTVAAAVALAAHAEEGAPIRGLIDPEGIEPSVWFQQMSEPRTGRNRVHLDVHVPHDVAAERVAAAVAAGGRLVSDQAAPSYWVLADAEGNEACICTWQDEG